MRFLWTAFKVLVALCVAIPLGIVALAVGFGVLGALLGLAVMVLKLGVLVLLGYGALRLAGALFRKPKPVPATPAHYTLPEPDRHYDAAMRELDEALGRPPRGS